MRCLFVNQFYPPDSTATAHLLGELTEDLAKFHEVWVVAGRPSYSPEVGNPPPIGVNVLRARTTTFNRANPIGRLVNYLSFFASSSIRVLRVRRPDVVVSLTNPPVIGLIASLAATRAKCPYVLWCQDIHPDIGLALRQFDNRLLVAGMRMVNQLIRSAASRIGVVGEDMRRKLENDGVPAGKLVFLPAWASASRLEPAERDHIAERMGWSDKIVVMHAGNMGAPQNLGIVLEAADLLRDRPEVHFVLMGDGSTKQFLVQRSKSMNLCNIEFLDPQERNHAQSLMAAADIHLISLAPGLLGCATPSKLYGIMASGRPFIAAVDEGSEPDRIVQEVGCGLRIAPGDGRALARAVMDLLEGPLDDMGLRGFRAFKDHFSREIVTNEFRRLLEALPRGFEAK